jgi:uncharacterized membrane protein YphA (DoxX/SURF4 family)
VALAIDMLVALVTAHIDKASSRATAATLVLGAACLGLAATGAGRFSVDAALGLTRRVSQRLSASPSAG